MARRPQGILPKNVALGVMVSRPHRIKALEWSAQTVPPESPSPPPKVIVPPTRLPNIGSLAEPYLLYGAL